MQDFMERANQWATHPFFLAKDRQEIQALIDKNQRKELAERFSANLAFGTGGMRGVVANGSNRMNIYNIQKATHALCKAIVQFNPQAEKKIAVSYDSRLSSEEFSRAVCEVIAGLGFKALLVPRLAPTPVLSYAVRHFGCAGGVMITASHNPPKYNGFKAYWSDGGQVTPPYDQHIIDQYLTTQWDDLAPLKFEQAKNEGLVEIISESFFQDYINVIQEQVLRPEEITGSHKPIKIIYTPLHGTGGWIMRGLMEQLGFQDFHIVPKQEQPDGNFPTTPSPNPEDSEALSLAVEQMQKQQAHLVLASDPDTDRMGVAINTKTGVRYLNGNEIANLMLFYKLEQLSLAGNLPANGLAIKTIVTSEIQQNICDAFNVQLENTLTGFKWMAALLAEKEKKQEAFQFLFASEESFGSMSHPAVRDKDGVSSVALMSELTQFYHNRGRSLDQILDELYERFGFFQESLLYRVYEGIEGQNKIQRIMDTFRNEIKEQLADYTIEEVIDYLASTKTVGGKTEPIAFTKSNVLGIKFTDGNRLYLRPSGTEPKIKFYTMVQETTGDLNSKKQKASQHIENIESAIRGICESV
jgi:phosphoglucomutase